LIFGCAACQSLRKNSGFVSRYRFIDTANPSKSDAPLGAGHRESTFSASASVCVRTDVLAIRWNEELDNAAPEGRTNLAQRFSVCVRTGVLAIRWNEELDNTAPEGRTNLAQRFSAGNSGKNDLSPGGTTQFSRTLFSSWLLASHMLAACSSLSFPA